MHNFLKESCKLGLGPNHSQKTPPLPSPPRPPPPTPETSPMGRIEDRAPPKREHLSSSKVETGAPDGPAWSADYQSGLMAESSLTMQIRSEEIGLAGFLYRQYVPTVTSLACLCRWYEQTAKHIMMFCPPYDGGSKGPVGASSSYDRLVNTARDLKNITHSSRILAQYPVAAEQLYG